MTARVADKNGWYEVPANPLSKAGVFQYKGSSINAPNPDATYNVYRPAEELADPETINSFRLVPFVNDHTMLGNPEVKPGYVSPEQKGVHGVTGDKIWFDPESQTLYGNLKVFSSSLTDAIDAGKKDLSLGYHCQYIAMPGVSPDGKPYDYIQRRIRGNHVALVTAGRCGDDVSVMDSLTVCFDEKELIPMATESIRKRNLKAHTAIVKSLVGSYARKANAKFPKLKLSVATMDAADDEAVASEPGLSDIADILGDVLPQIADINAAIADAVSPPDDDGMEDEMEPEMDSAGMPMMDEAGKPKMKPVMDAATGKPKRVAKKVAPDDKAPPAMDVKAMDAAINAKLAPLRTELETLRKGGIKSIVSEINQRNALAGKISAFVGTFDHAEMTLQEVAAYGVKKLEVPAMDGQELSAINAYLHGRTPPAPRLVSGTGMDDKGGTGDSVAKYLAG